MYHKIILLFLLAFMQCSLIAQSRVDSLDFSDVDSFVLTVKYENDIIKLANDLAAPYAEDVYRARAFFKWITNNIEYDYRFINSGKELKAPDCDDMDQSDCIEKTREWETNYLKRILVRRKAVAEGYSKLLKKLCDIVFIQAEVITGYARTRPYQVGNNMPVNHFWNAIMIDADWYYLDATWAAGYCPENEETGKLLRYVKEYRDYYWLSKFDRFSRNHYPRKGNFVEPVALTKEQFFMRPHYYSIDILENITEEVPSTGVLKVKKGETVHFKFNYNRDIKLLQVNSNIFRNPSLWTTVQVSKRKTKVVRDTWAEKKQQYVSFKRQGNVYEFDYPVTDNSLYYLELAFDYKPAIRYRVRVEN